MNVSEYHNGAGNGDELKQQQEAVGYAEDGKRQVIIVLDPVVAATEETKRDGQNGHQYTEHSCPSQVRAMHQPTKS